MTYSTLFLSGKGTINFEMSNNSDFKNMKVENWSVQSTSKIVLLHIKEVSLFTSQPEFRDVVSSLTLYSHRESKAESGILPYIPGQITFYITDDKNKPLNDDFHIRLTSF